MHSAVATILVLAEGTTPDPDDVVAGWSGFTVFILLIVAVGLLGWALSRSLRTASRAKDAGVYGDPPADEQVESSGATDSADVAADPSGEREPHRQDGA